MRIGDIFLKSGLITQAQLDTALAEKAKNPHLKLGEVLVQCRFTTDRSVAMALATQLRIPFVDLAAMSLEPELVREIDPKLANRHLVIPIEKRGSKLLKIAMADPLDFDAIQAVQFKTGCTVSPTVAGANDIRAAIDRYYQMDDDVEGILGVLKGDSSSGSKSVPARSSIARKGKTQPVEAAEDDDFSEIVAEMEPQEEGDEQLNATELKRQGESAPLVRLVNMILQRAVRMEASDVHIESEERVVNVRYRIDGLMHPIMSLPKWLLGGMVSRIKIMSGLDISERRAPQDGKVKIRVGLKAYDVRVSTLPTRFGEKVVMRMLSTSNAIGSLDMIGLLPSALRAMLPLTELKHGLVLITGPTGSGKSTTLYAFIKELLAHSPNIITFEDPIEYQLQGVNQVQINEKANLTFANGLRSALRQDPDVIMVGEIRDKETLEIALQASITGHLVLSTLHTNDAATSIARLLHLGAKPFQLSAGLAGIVAQRLVRMICSVCRQQQEPSADALSRLRSQLGAKLPSTFYHGRGCERCLGSGYRGRIGVYEVLTIDAAMQRVIIESGSDLQVRETAIEGGMVPMVLDCIDKVRFGLTTIEETERVFVLEAQTTKACPACERAVHPDFTVCPFCSFVLNNRCLSCSRELDPQWTICPYCRTPAGSKFAAPEAMVQRSMSVAAAPAGPPVSVAAVPAPPASPSPPSRAPVDHALVTAPSIRSVPVPAAMEAVFAALAHTPEPGAAPPTEESDNGEETTDLVPSNFALPSTSPSSGDVLIVDADPATQRLVGEHLRENRFEVRTAKDGFEGLAQILARPPRVIILGAETMKSGGYELVRTIRNDASRASIPIIMLSSHAAIEEKLYGMSFGIDDFLDRPFALDDLLERTRSALRRVYGQL
jgi:type IV pilus assembly protein PilB